MTKNGLKRALSLLLSAIFVFARHFTGFRGGFQGRFGKQNRGCRGKEKQNEQK